MYGKPAMTCFNYLDTYLSGSEAITYLNAILEWLQSQQFESSDFPNPHYRQHPPPPPRMAAEPSPIWKRTLVWLNYHTYGKK
jgi:hypothetical protein